MSIVGSATAFDYHRDFESSSDILVNLILCNRKEVMLGRGKYPLFYYYTLVERLS